MDFSEKEEILNKLKRISADYLIKQWWNNNNNNNKIRNSWSSKCISSTPNERENQNQMFDENIGMEIHTFKIFTIKKHS